MLDMLKIDLGISGDAYDNWLRQYLETAERQIAREGVTLTDSIDDRQLTVAYAAWLWRRRDNMQGMPRMLRYLLNNRLFAEKMREAD